jgi:hypothetical protein
MNATSGTFNWLAAEDNLLTGLPDFPADAYFFKFQVHDNQITSLPASICNARFGWLLIYGNQLTSLPDSFGNISVSQLNLKDNQIAALPDNFGNLSNVMRIHLERNNLTALPESFCNLSTLEQCYLIGNDIASLPDNFGNLSALRWFRIDSNQLANLPASIVNINLSTNQTSFGHNKLCGLSSGLQTWLNSKDADWADTQIGCGTVSADRRLNGIKRFHVWQNSPSPFTGATAIQFQLPSNRRVKLEVFNITGQKVALLLDENRKAGLHRIQWHAGELPSGIYYYKITAGRYTALKKTTLIK